MDNFQAQCDEILSGIEAATKTDSKPQNGAAAFLGTVAKPRLLLHACCAPCSSYTLEYLCKYFDITIYYYNPNIHPAEEYARRLNELENFLPRFLTAQKTSAETDGKTKTQAAAIKVALQEAAYDPQEFFDAVQAERDNLQAEPERGERCHRCYLLRMEKAYKYARQNNFDWFTTTLSISPHKDAQKINQIGRALEQAALEQNASQDQKAPRWLPSDFKKKNGYKRSLELSKEYGLYRQDYCGCVYSKENIERSRAGGCLN